MKKILLVDDESSVLNAFQKALGKQFPLETACGPAEGLAALKNWQNFSVVLSDMNMPEMTGVEFLAKVKQIAPDVVRMMLTGNADQATAIKAINQGHIFRFLNKPCSGRDLAEAFTAGIRQHQLIIAEKELLEKTLQGSVKILTDILALAEPKAFGYAEKVRDYMRLLAAAMHVENSWELEIAALLSQVGFMTIPPEVIIKFRAGGDLTEQEQELFRCIPAIGGRLLSQIPRLEEVSKILTYQNKRFDGSGMPDDAVSGTDIPQGSRMLKFLADLAELEARGKSRADALDKMRVRTGWYDPHVLEIVSSQHFGTSLMQDSPTMPPLPITFSQLRVGQVLCADVYTGDDILIVACGNRISPPLMERLRNFHALSGIKEPILVQS